MDNDDNINKELKKNNLTLKTLVDGLICSFENQHEDRSFGKKEKSRNGWRTNGNQGGKKATNFLPRTLLACVGRRSFFVFVFLFRNKTNLWLKSICCFPGKLKTGVSAALWSAAQIIFREPWGKENAHEKDSKTRFLGLHYQQQSRDSVTPLL